MLLFLVRCHRLAHLGPIAQTPHRVLLRLSPNKLLPKCAPILLHSGQLTSRYWPWTHRLFDVATTLFLFFFSSPIHWGRLPIDYYHVILNICTIYIHFHCWHCISIFNKSRDNENKACVTQTLCKHSNYHFESVLLLQNNVGVKISPSTQKHMHK